MLTVTLIEAKKTLSLSGLSYMLLYLQIPISCFIITVQNSTYIFIVYFVVQYAICDTLQDTITFVTRITLKNDLIYQCQKQKRIKSHFKIRCVTCDPIPFFFLAALLLQYLYLPLPIRNYLVLKHTSAC
jgi:hypothetical protein